MPFIKGNIPHNKGKKLSEDTKKAVSETRLKKFKEGKIKIWNKSKKMSEDFKKKLSLFYKENPFSEEHRRNISKAKKGKKPYEMTDKTREKMSKSFKGRKLKPLTEEQKRKISIANKKVIHTPEWNLKIGLTKRGVKKSEKTRQKMSEARLKRVFPIKDTSIEVKLQNFLKEQHIEFSTHYPILGQPDIFIKPNICIFADGCYWHKCPECGFGHGKERDVMVTRELQKQGYVVIRMWEHEINDSSFTESMNLKQTRWQKLLPK